MIKGHIIGSTTFMWALILLYFQLLFAFIKYIYKWSSYIFCVIWFGSLIFNWVAASWVAMNTCTSTELYGLALFNTIFYFIVQFLFMLTVTLVLFIRALILTRSSVTPHKPKEAPKEHLGESEERMIEDKDDHHANGEGEDDTEDDKAKLRMTKEPRQDIEEEKQPRRRNNDPEDEDEEEPEQKVEDELENELEKIE